jgi:hypothetical protein
MSAEARCPECGEAVQSGERCCGVRRLTTLPELPTHPPRPVASFWVRGVLVRYTDSWQWLSGVEWQPANKALLRTVADHLAEHCASDGWPSHEADRALDHSTFLDRLMGES